MLVAHGKRKAMRRILNHFTGFFCFYVFLQPISAEQQQKQSNKPAFPYSRVCRQNASLILETSDTLTWFKVAMQRCSVHNNYLWPFMILKLNSFPLSSREGGETCFVTN